MLVKQQVVSGPCLFAHQQVHKYMHDAKSQSLACANLDTQQNEYCVYSLVVHYSTDDGAFAPHRQHARIPDVGKKL